MFIYSTYDKDPGSPLYTAEAFLSASSLRRHTTRDIGLLTNNAALAASIAKLPHNPFSHIELTTGETHPKLQKIRAIGRLWSGDKVFLDCDTLVFDAIDRVFDFAAFDIAGVVAPARGFIRSIEDAVEKEAKQIYSLNSGVLFIRERFVADLVATWAMRYEVLLRNKGEGAFDQAALKRSLNALTPRVLMLPHNYNFRINFGGTISGKCFVIHAHFRPAAQRLLESDMNADVVKDFIEGAEVINRSMETANFPPMTTIDYAALARKPLPWRI